MTDTPEDYELAHFGIKGMKWGVRRKTNSEGLVEKKPPMSREDRVAVAKKAAVGTGILLAAVGSAIVASKLGTDGDTPIESIPETKPKLPDMENLIFASKPKNAGFMVMNNGNHPSPIEMMDEVFGDKAVGPETDTLIDSPRGKGIYLSDPEGRKDRAGRPISHVILIPNSMKDSVNSRDDVVNDIWPKVKDDYDYDYTIPDRW